MSVAKVTISIEANLLKRVDRESRTSKEVASPSFILPLDVRGKQRLSFGVVRYTLACVYSVSPHVNSIVMPLLFEIGIDFWCD
jgi:hypothetical protein